MLQRGVARHCRRTSRSAAWLYPFMGDYESAHRYPAWPARTRAPRERRRHSSRTDPRAAHRRRVKFKIRTKHLAGARLPAPQRFRVWSPPRPTTCGAVSGKPPSHRRRPPTDPRGPREVAGPGSPSRAGPAGAGRAPSRAAGAATRLRSAGAASAGSPGSSARSARCGERRWGSRPARSAAWA